jgi:MoaA/NifB/PqqE/SkfB family radical SAM enzyme
MNTVSLQAGSWPKKVQTFQSCLKHVRNKAVTLTSRPLEMQLEVTTKCNLWCTMCATTYDRSRTERGLTGHMSLEALENLKGILPFVVRCYMFGNGEPLLHPHFLDFVRVISDYGVVIQFNTNGTLLDEKMRDGLVSSRVDTITFSIDGATKETYESIRVGAKFATVIGNIKALSQLKKEKGQNSPHLGIAMVAMRQNIEEFPAMVSLAADLGVENVHLEPLIWQGDPAYRKYYAEQNLSNLDSRKVMAILEQARTVGANCGVRLSSPFFAQRGNYDYPAMVATTQRSSQRTTDLICTEPWTTIFVKWNGEVRTCCASQAIFGDVSKSSIEDIWNNDEYKSYRYRLAYGNPPPECLNCIKNGRTRHVIAEIAYLLSQHPITKKHGFGDRMWLIIRSKILSL